MKIVILHFLNVKKQKNKGENKKALYEKKRLNAKELYCVKYV